MSQLAQQRDSTLSIRIDGARVFRLLLTRSQARALRDTLERAQARIGSRSATGRASDEDLLDLMVAAIEAESLDYQEHQ